MVLDGGRAASYRNLSGTTFSERIMKRIKDKTLLTWIAITGIIVIASGVKSGKL